MRKERLFAVPACLVLLCAVLPVLAAHAQEQAGQENIEIGLSTDEVAITSGFAGTNLTIFGALDNPDPLTSRHGRYDVVVVLEGPENSVVVRKKTRVLGVWVNTQSMMFSNVPASYAVATTRAPQDITQDDVYRRLSLGADYVHLKSAEPEAGPETIRRFAQALRERKKSNGLYTLRVGGVQFLSQSLFRATLALAPNVPVGTHTARAFLFRSGVFLKQTSAPLTIKKAGLEQRVYDVAHDDSFVYGLAAVALAMLMGWMGRLVFRRD